MSVSIITPLSRTGILTALNDANTSHTHIYFNDIYRWREVPALINRLRTAGIPVLFIVRYLDSTNQLMIKIASSRRLMNMYIDYPNVGWGVVGIYIRTRDAAIAKLIFA